MGKQVKLYTDERMVSMTVDRVEYPFIIGTKPKSDNPKEIRVDLRDVNKIETHDPDREGRRFVATFLVVGALAAVVLATFKFPE